jgi:hypothetical protein
LKMRTEQYSGHTIMDAPPRSQITATGIAGTSEFPGQRPSALAPETSRTQQPPSMVCVAYRNQVLAGLGTIIVGTGE